MLERLTETGRGVVAQLAELVLPAACGGCGTAGGSLCTGCRAVLAASPEASRPVPAPAGLPPCLTGGEYAGALREAILGYKERGRRDLTRPLGAALARVVAAGCPAAVPVALVPVPATAAAVRARHGDHMLRLARVAARVLRASGHPAGVATGLRARAKPDAAHLDRQGRADAARQAFVARTERAGVLRDLADAGLVVLVDDVLTTGATLAAVATQLLTAGVPVAFAATLAATRLRHAPPIS